MAFAVFENALTYWFIAVSALRICLGIVTIILAKKALGEEKNSNAELFEKLKLRPGNFFSFVFGFVLLICGILLTIGLFTQVAALVLGILSLLIITIKLIKGVPKSESVLFYFLLASICFSLIYLGAGAIALDLPL